jgi:hypothetical protein
VNACGVSTAYQKRHGFWPNLWQGFGDRSYRFALRRDDRSKDAAGFERLPKRWCSSAALPDP